MINQGTYENLSFELVSAAELAVNEIGLILKKLNQVAIKDPDAVIQLKRKYETEIVKIIKKYKKDADNWADIYVAKAYIEGLKHADSILKANGLNTKTDEIINGSFLIKSPPAIPPVPPIPGQVLGWFDGWENHTQFFGVFRNAAYYSIDQQPLQILRASDDLYREVSIISGENLYKEGDIFTRRKLSQDYLNEFAKKGVQSITYKDGKKFSLDTYSEMLGRTVTGRAAVQASLNRYVETGYQLGIVSAHFRACPLCTPYEGRILSLTGKHPEYESVWDAETQGLWHPNCKHDISVYIEGVSGPLEIKTHPEEQALIDELGYDKAQKQTYNAQVQQRYIERNIRHWKRRSNLALDNNIKIYSNKKVREWQKKQREHLQDNKFLKRQYQRESIKKAH